MLMLRSWIIIDTGLPYLYECHDRERRLPLTRYSCTKAFNSGRVILGFLIRCCNAELHPFRDEPTEEILTMRPFCVIDGMNC